MLMLLLSTSLLHLENAVSSLRPSVTESSPASCSMIGPERPAEREKGQHHQFTRHNINFAMPLETIGLIEMQNFPRGVKQLPVSSRRIRGQEMGVNEGKGCRLG